MALPWLKVCRCLMGAVLAVCLVLLAGCGKGESTGELTDTAETVKRLTHLRVLHVQCIAANQGRPPANEAGFKSQLQKLPKERLSDMGVSDINSLFISPRDKQPFVIDYSGSKPVFAYEKTGAGGKRCVVLSGGETEEADEARAKELQLK